MLLVSCALPRNPIVPFPAVATPFPSPEIRSITTETQTATATQAAATGAVPTSAPDVAPTLTPTPAPLFTFWISPIIHDQIREQVVLPAGSAWGETAQTSDVRLEVGAGNPFFYWIYALVAPFPTIPDSVSFQDLQQSWAGEPAGPFTGQPLLLDQVTLDAFTVLWGGPAAGAVQVLAPGEFSSYAWNHQPSWAIVPFEDLAPHWKVLEVDGQSPLRNDFNQDLYPLAVPVSLMGDEPLFELFNSPLQTIQSLLPAGNRDPEKLTVLAMTGVTALVRGTSNTMYGKGTLYPAEEIGPLLRSADITHVSNEVPFAEDCPAYTTDFYGLVFCTYPGYIELLEDVGTDIVELTGDHFADWGTEATQYTLELYKEKGWPYYGGGENLEDGLQPALLEHHGNRLAFIGCNAKGGGYATAAENTPGAVACNWEYMTSEIASLRDQGYLVVATFQHDEVYAYWPTPGMREDFLRVAEAGAHIVSGSQAHQPHGFEFLNNTLIHYGLGNLFFDQFGFFDDQIADRAFIDRHVFYDGRYIGTELITIQFIDLARTRFMTLDERAAFLELIFNASGW